MGKRRRGSLRRRQLVRVMAGLVRVLLSDKIVSSCLNGGKDCLLQIRPAISCNIYAQHHPETPTPRDSVIRSIPIPTRCARLTGTQKYLRYRSVSKEHHDKDSEELSERLPQSHAHFRPPPVAVLCQVVLFGDGRRGCEAEERAPASDTGGGFVQIAVSRREADVLVVRDSGCGDVVQGERVVMIVFLFDWRWSSVREKRVPTHGLLPRCYSRGCGCLGGHVMEEVELLTFDE